MFKYFTIFICLVVLASCKKEVNSVGSDIIGSTSPYVGAIDTFTIHTSTKVEDSVFTDHPSYLLLGRMVDPTVGIVNAGFCSQLRLVSLSPNFGDLDQISIDSVVLSIKYIDSYGPQAPLKFEVYRLTQEILSSSYTNSSVVSDDGVNLAYSDDMVTPRINGSSFVSSLGDTIYDQITIRLKNELGTTLIEQSKNSNSTYASVDNFNSWFKGIRVVAKNDQLVKGQGAIYYIATSPKITIYYKLGTQTKSYYFELNQNANRFNQLSFDSKGSDAENYIDKIDVESFYGQANHLRSYIEIPSLSKLSSKSVVHSAVLTLPYDNSDDVLYNPGTLISVSIPNSEYDNRLRFIQSGSIDTLNKIFTIDLRDHIQNLITGKRLNLGLYISPAEFSTTATRIKFLNKEGQKPKLYLKISSFNN
jgi:hypothetical protein